MISVLMSLLNFGIRNWKYILIVLALMSAGFYAAWQIQGIRVEKLKLEASRLQADVAVCQEANKTNQGAIKRLGTEVKSAHAMCSSRIKTKDSLIARLKNIDELEIKTQETMKDEKSITAVDDPILHELNRMFNSDKAGH